MQVHQLLRKALLSQIVDLESWLTGQVGAAFQSHTVRLSDGKVLKLEIW